MANIVTKFIAVLGIGVLPFFQLAGALPGASPEDYDPHVLLELTATLELADEMSCVAPTGSRDTAESGMQPAEEKLGWMHLFAEHLPASTRDE